MGMQAFLSGRDSCPQLHTLDVGYSAVTQDALSVAERIYAHAGMPAMSARAREAMRQWDAANTQHKHGAHKYSLEEYSLDAVTVKETFRPYRERFGAYL